MESCKLNKINSKEYLKYIIPLRLNKESVPTPAKYKELMQKKSAIAA